MSLTPYLNRRLPRSLRRVWLIVLAAGLTADGTPRAQAQQAMPFSVAEEAPTSPLLVSPQGIPLVPPASVVAPVTPPAIVAPEMSMDGAYLAGPSPNGLGSDSWTWQLLPEGLIYKNYLASNLEPRLGTQFVFEKGSHWLWDTSIGGHVGLLRYGTGSPLWPEGWQVDAEAVAIPRLDLTDQRNLVSADFRVGFPLTWRSGRLESKFGYYHISSHVGDEFMVQQGSLDRINYVRDSLAWGVAVRPVPDLRLYAEADWAFYYDGGAKPWEFQFGIDYSRAESHGPRPYPFFAVNARFREDADYSGNFTAQTGLQWRTQAGRLLRFGAHYFNGLTERREFFRMFEEQIGLGVWYDY